MQALQSNRDVKQVGGLSLEQVEQIINIFKISIYAKIT